MGAVSKFLYTVKLYYNAKKIGFPNLFYIITKRVVGLIDVALLHCALRLINSQRWSY